MNNGRSNAKAYLTSILAGMRISAGEMDLGG